MSRIRHVAYVVQDLETTAKFFEDYVGFERVGEPRRAGNYPGNSQNMTDGDVVLTLLCPDPEIERLPWMYGTAGPNHIGIETERAEEIQAKLREGGYKVYAESGRRGFFKFRDPNGVEIDVAPPNGWRWGRREQQTATA
jgi:catechol 2,3-dioxygenase-like lactoylglutathione lyase family enzyme